MASETGQQEPGQENQESLPAILGELTPTALAAAKEGLRAAAKSRVQKVTFAVGFFSGLLPACFLALLYPLLSESTPEFMGLLLVWSSLCGFYGSSSPRLRQRFSTELELRQALSALLEEQVEVLNRWKADSTANLDTLREEMLADGTSKTGVRKIIGPKRQAIAQKYSSKLNALYENNSSTPAPALPEHSGVDDSAAMPEPSDTLKQPQPLPGSSETK